MSFPALKQAEERLGAVQKKLQDIFAEAGPEMDMTAVKSLDGDSRAKVDEIRKLNEEAAEVGNEVDALKSVASAAERVKRAQAKGEAAAEAQSGDGAELKGGREVERKSFGELFTESDAFKTKGASADIEIEFKTLMETGAGFAPETTRTGRIVDYATRPVQVTDLIPTTTTSQAALVYMEETTFTNNAAEAAEGATYGEAALALTERSSTVRKVATWLPVTDEQLEDEAQARGYINNRLPFMLRQRLDGQILTGNGTAPNLRGILNVSGISTQAKGTDPIPDAVFKAMTAVRVTGRATPGAIVFHPTNWQSVRLLRTADGVYIWGSPAEAGPERIWGIQVVQSDAITLGTAVVGDWQMHSELSVRRGIEVQVTNSHSDYFINGKQAMRADMRAALVFYRPAAFCTVTGL